MSEYPHRDTIVVGTQDLSDFGSLCDNLGISYWIYARPADPHDWGNCLIQLSADDMNLLSLSSNRVRAGLAGGM